MRNLTIVIPGLNEENHIEITVSEIISISRSVVNAFEMILINDGSTDNTSKIMNSLAIRYPEVRVIHNSVPHGLNWVLLEGIKQAKFDYINYLPGDHAYNAESLRDFYLALGNADLIVGYRINQAEGRPLYRAILSKLYTRIMGVFFGFWLEDVHGPMIYPINRLRQLNLVMHGNGAYIEILVSLMRTKISYLQVPVRLNPSDDAHSGTLTWKTLQNVLQTIWTLLHK